MTLDKFYVLFLLERQEEEDSLKTFGSTFTNFGLIYSLSMAFEVVGSLKSHRSERFD